MLLLDLAGQFPGNVTIIPFSHSQEAQIDGDWAWAFVGPGGRPCQGMLVQAKRLDDRDRVYPALLYKGGQGGTGTASSQMERLIANGRRFGLPPVYAFYNHLSDPTRVPTGSCRSLDMLQQPLPESWGVAIASAISVRDARPDKTYDRHRHHSRPLHCLLCSSGSGRQHPLGSAGAAAAARSVLFEGAGEDDGLEPDMIPPFEPTRELPELFRYVEELHRARTTGAGASLADLDSEFRGITSVVIVRDSEGKETWSDETPRTW